MQRIAIRSLAAVIGSIFISVAIGLVVIPLLGGRFDPLAMSMCVVCPVIIAGPVSFWAQLNRKQLADAHAELCKAHGKLAQAHADLADAHGRLAEKARLDDMTGMLNRESFFAALENVRRTVDTGTLLIIDADNFKRINDNHGHLAGDEALLAISDAIGRALRDDDLCGRIGGEEFGVFLPVADLAESLHVAERIRKEVSQIEFRPKDGSLVPLSVSIGATSHRQGAMLSDLMQEADGRLYEAKRAGRNRVIFAPVQSKAA